MNVQVAGYSLGAIIALVVLIIAVLLLILRTLGPGVEVPVGVVLALIGGVALARLL